MVGAIPENKGPNMRWVEDLTKVVDSAKDRKKERKKFLVPILCWKVGNCK